jgi:hypothetical protein
MVDEKGKSKQFTYTHAKESPRFNVSGLADGVYRYAASTIMKGKEERVSGQFVISNADLELSNTTADFGMLRDLAAVGRNIYHACIFQQFIQKLKNDRPADRLDSSEDMVELIYLKWLFFLLVVLLGAEWGLRKYHGGY